MMRLYLAGKITGDEGYREKFRAIADTLTLIGYKIMNPAMLPEGFAYEEYMHICFAMIDVCDGVVFLDDWIESPGAIREREYALGACKAIYLSRDLIAGRKV